MDPKELKRLLDALKDAEVSEFSLETPEYKVSVKRGVEVIHVAAPTVSVPVAPTVVSAPSPAAVPQPTVISSASSTPTTEAPTPPVAAQGHTQKAPIVGTFYSSSSPETAAFVQVGDRVEIGKVLCIIEAMKLMNEIEAEIAGVVREILVSNAQPVEYGQPLFVIE